MTELQKITLSKLAALRYHAPRTQPLGFNPVNFGGARSAACARIMAAKGWVTLHRLAKGHIRYAITEAGYRALVLA